MSIEKEILKLYKQIGESKKFINEATDVYDNVNFKDRVVGSSTPSKDNINTALLADVQTAAKAAGVNVDITTAVSGHDKGSRHESGDAVDIAIINGKAVSSSNRADAEKFVNALVSMGYVKNVEKGNEKAVLTFGFPGHDNHVHVSNKGTSTSTVTSGTTNNSSEDAYNYASTGKSAEQSSDTSVSQYGSLVSGGQSTKGVMEQDDDINDILEIYNNMIHTSNIVEVLSASDELFGGDDVKIPADGAHGGQSGWQSANAWDIKGAVGAPVYALADGVAQTFSDYGRNVRKTQGKKLYGQSFTVKSDGGLPSIYYTHLEGSPVTKGSKIECGQFLGYIMDFPGSSYDHVHIGVESGNIRQFLNDDGTLKCAKGQKISGGEIGEPTKSDSASEDAYNYAATGQSSQKSSDTSISQYGSLVSGGQSTKGLTEQRNFGKNVSNRYGRVIIPKEDNSRIKAPISGVINNRRYSSSCTNQITIENNDNGKVYLQFCGISNPSVRNGKSVSVGDTLGTTDSDVEVTMFDSSWNRINIPEKDLKINKREKEVELDTKKKRPSEPEYYDPVMAALMGLPSLLFKDKYDDSGNRVEKRYGGVADKKQVDPWVLNFIKDPFKRKKVNENIEKIKKML